MPCRYLKKAWIAAVLIMVTAIGSLCNAAVSAPSLVSPGNGVGGRQILLTLTWSTAPNATAYAVQAATSSSFATTVLSSAPQPGTSLLLQNLSPSTVYYWRVMGSDTTLGASPWSDVWSFTTLHYAYDTATGSSMSIILQTSVQPTINGAPLGQYDEIGVFSKAGLCVGNAVWDSVNNKNINVAGQDNMSSTADGLSAGDTLYFRAWDYSTQQEAPATVGFAIGSPVFANGGIAVIGSFSALAVPDQPLLAAPRNNSGATPVTLSLSWNSSARAASYSLQVATGTAFSTTITGQSGISGLSVTIGPLAGNAVYFWRVCAVNVSGAGAWSGAWTFSPLPENPLIIHASWNLKSINAVPPDDSMNAVFGGSSQGVFVVKDNAGDVYFPMLGQDDIHQLQLGQGYQIYSAAPDTIPIYGAPVNPAVNPIALAAGWNTIGYLPQANDSLWHAVAGIASRITVIKNNSGHACWPALSIDNLGVMQAGEGYKVLMSAAASLTYPTPLALSKQVSCPGPVLHLPDPRHYAVHANTGNNAIVLCRSVTARGRIVPDSSEVGAFDATGSLIGSGTVVHGRTLFAVWGSDPFSKSKDGAAPGETVSFRLWDGAGEFPLVFAPEAGSGSRYSVDGIIAGSLAMPPDNCGTVLNSVSVYPNPFRGGLHIAFEVPATDDARDRALSVAIYDLQGRVAAQLFNGFALPGRHLLTWSAGPAEGSETGAGTFIARIRAAGVDKQIRIVKLNNY